MSEELQFLALGHNVELKDIPDEILPPYTKTELEILEQAEQDCVGWKTELANLEQTLTKLQKDSQTYYTGKEWDYCLRLKRLSKSRLDQSQKDRLQKALTNSAQYSELEKKYIEQIDILDNKVKQCLGDAAFQVRDSRVKRYLLFQTRLKLTKGKSQIPEDLTLKKDTSPKQHKPGKETLHIPIQAEIHPPPVQAGEELLGAVGGAPLPDQPVQEGQLVLPVQEVQNRVQPVQVETDRDKVGNLPKQNFQPEIPPEPLENQGNRILETFVNAVRALQPVDRVVDQQFEPIPEDSDRDSNPDFDRVSEADFDRVSEPEAEVANPVQIANRDLENRQQVDNNIPDIFNNLDIFGNLRQILEDNQFPNQIPIMADNDIAVNIPKNLLHQGKAPLDKFSGENGVDPEQHLSTFADYVLTGWGIDITHNLAIIPQVAAQGGNPAIPAYHQAQIVIPQFRGSLTGLAREWFNSTFDQGGPYTNARWEELRDAFKARFNISGDTENDKFLYWLNFPKTWDASKEDVEKMVMRMKACGRKLEPPANPAQLRMMLVAAIGWNDPEVEEKCHFVNEFDDIVKMVKRFQKRKAMKGKPVDQVSTTQEATSTPQFLVQLDSLGRQEKLLAGVLDEQKQFREDMMMVTEELRNMSFRDRRGRNPTPYRRDGSRERSQSRDRYRRNDGYSSYSRNYDNGRSRDYDNGRSRDYDRSRGNYRNRDGYRPRYRSQSRDSQSRSRERSQSRDRYGNRRSYGGDNQRNGKNFKRSENRGSRRNYRNDDIYCSHCRMTSHLAEDCWKLRDKFQREAPTKRVIFESDIKSRSRDRSESRDRDDKDEANCMKQNIFAYLQDQFEKSTNC